ncbi:MAG TPA: photosynthetic reaction center cytochrome c subunit family protein [Steroidobacteraceae bacterium]|jgi:hypothetical protein
MSTLRGAAALGACLVAVAWAQAPAQEPPKEELLAELRRQIAGREQEPAEAVFRDIEVMKGRTAEQLLAVMDLGYSRSLGVGCGHCHDTGDWPADAKPQKQVARQMTLMNREINAKLRTIEGLESDPPVINCTTCHRGQKKPALNLDPPPPAPGG